MEEIWSICEYNECKKKFKRTRHWQKFCNSTCRKKAWGEKYGKDDIKKLNKRIQAVEEELKKYTSPISENSTERLRRNK